MVEVVGYVGSALVVTSLTMSSLFRLRIVSLFGAIVFATYGALIESVPIVVTNGVIFAIDVYFLWKASTDKDYFSLLRVSPSSLYLAEFLSFHADDITRFIPEFRHEPESDDVDVLLMRNMVPAGVFVARPTEDTATLRILVDYAIPAYRDFRLGTYLYRERAGVFAEAGVDRLVVDAKVPAHVKYLERMGFSGKGNRFELILP